MIEIVIENYGITLIQGRLYVQPLLSPITDDNGDMGHKSDLGIFHHFYVNMAGMWNNNPERVPINNIALNPYLRFDKYFLGPDPPALWCVNPLPTRSPLGWDTSKGLATLVRDSYSG